MLKRIYIVMLTLLLTCVGSVYASEEKEESLDVKGIIFEHLGDGYGWEVPFSHTYRIPLPVIVRAEDGQWFTFMSSDLTEILEHKNQETGKVEKHAVPVIKVCERNGKEYRFAVAQFSKDHKDKLVELFELNSDDQTILDDALGENYGDQGLAMPLVSGYVFVPSLHESGEGQYYKEYRPLDLSITKNVAALFIAALLVIWLVFSLVHYYKKHGLRAPRKGMGFLEMIVSFIYYDTIKATLGPKTNKFAPYLLTVFFFILLMNIAGLVVIFPGGANLTGNIAITLVLALCTFILTNVLGTKHYWKDIFWPDVPIWLKFPLPIMQVIEVFGIFTKPAALAVRLFANMMGGHMIVITLTLLIFIFASFGAAVMGGATVISVLFSVFMLLLDVLVSFIQAYVFTLLSTLFIAAAQESGEHHDEKRDAGDAAKELADRELLADQKARLHAEAEKIDAV